MLRNTNEAYCWMSKSLSSIEVNTGIGEALNLMHHNNFRHLLITERGKLTGVVSQEDLSNALQRNKSRVDSVMATDIQTFRENTPLLEIVRYFIGKKCSLVPIVDEDELLIGVISNHDLLVALETCLLEKQVNA